MTLLSQSMLGTGRLSLASCGCGSGQLAGGNRWLAAVVERFPRRAHGLDSAAICSQRWLPAPRSFRPSPCGRCSSTPLDEVRAVILGKTPTTGAVRPRVWPFQWRQGVRLAALAAQHLQGTCAGSGCSAALILPTAAACMPWAQRGVLLLEHLLDGRRGAAGQPCQVGLGSAY